MTIRPLTPADAAAFQTLRLSGLRESPTAFGSSVEEESERTLEEVAASLGPASGRHMFGAFTADGELVGIVGVGRERGRKEQHHGFIRSMYVAPSHRGTGLGRRLMDTALAFAATLPGLRQLTLAVTVGNDAARVLYESVGFRVYGRVPATLLVDGVFHDEFGMVLRLGEPPADADGGWVHEHSRAPGSRFTDVDLRGAVFDDVDLRRARFENTTLAGATLRNVSLKDVSIEDAALDGMRIGGISVGEMMRAHAAARRAGEPAHAVLYAKEPQLLAAFYTAVAGLALSRAAPDHLVLVSPAWELALIEIPEAIAAGIHIASPPVRREETPIKLVFSVPSLAAAREAAASRGGELDPPEREWRYRGFRVCDGHDPEGNVLQLRQREGGSEDGSEGEA